MVKKSFFIISLVFVFITSLGSLDFSPWRFPKNHTFVESGGMVVMEAENFTGSVERTSHSWQRLFMYRGFSGSGYIMTIPDTGKNIDTGYTDTSPETIYNVYFSEPGIYYVWTRACGMHIESNSAHAGINGEENLSANRLNFSIGMWRWTCGRMDADRAYIIVPEPGTHSINLWMREDGALVDKILLTQDPDYRPLGTGPAESRIIPGIGEPTPTPSPGLTVTTSQTPSGATSDTTLPPTPTGPTNVPTLTPSPTPHILTGTPTPASAPSQTPPGTTLTPDPGITPTPAGGTPFPTEPVTPAPTPDWDYQVRVYYEYPFPGSLLVDPPDVFGNNSLECRGAFSSFFYNQGTTVTLTIDPPEIFSAWTGELEGTILPVTFVVNNDMTIFADLINPIQDAVDAAKPGGIVTTGPGVFYEPVVLKPCIILQGAGTGESILAGSDPDLVTITAADHCIISGFTFTGDTIRILCDNTSPLIMHNHLEDGGRPHIECINSSAIIVNNIIEGGNSGIICTGDSSVSLYGNTISSRGFGITSTGAEFICNNIFSHNWTAIACEVTSTAQIINNTILYSRQSAVFAVESPSVITNNIIAANLIGLELSDSPAVIRYNNVWSNGTDYDGAYPGIGDISMDPLFTFQEGEDYHLTTGSPCIDAGTNKAEGLPWTDFDGHYRIIDGDCDGKARVDMGAFEYIPVRGTEGPTAVPTGTPTESPTPTPSGGTGTSTPVASYTPVPAVTYTPTPVGR